MDEQKDERTYILLNDEIMEEIMPPLIEEVMGPEYDFEVTRVTYVDEILEAAERQSFDLFALLLNNIIFREDIMPRESTINKPLRLIIYLKARYDTPIIGFYGYPRDPAYAKQARLAGADFAFQIPCSMEVLRGPVKQCLDRSSGKKYS